MMPSDNMRAAEDASAAQVDLDDVLAGCRAGEREAQRRLYERCTNQVYRLMVRMVGVHDAADLTQQVFLQLFRKIDQFAGRSKFDTWLYRLAVNEALQHLRKGNRWNVQTLSREPESHHASAGERQEYKELLDQALARLEPELCSVFVLRSVEGLSYREIAEAIDIPDPKNLSVCWDVITIKWMPASFLIALLTCLGLALRPAVPAEQKAELG